MVVSPPRPLAPPKVSHPGRAEPKEAPSLGNPSTGTPKGLTSLDSSREGSEKESSGPGGWVLALGSAFHLCNPEREPPVSDPQFWPLQSPDIFPFYPHTCALEKAAMLPTLGPAACSFFTQFSSSLPKYVLKRT